LKKKELVSIVIPAFNAEGEIDKCIHYLMQQTYKNYEVIIVNDGSTDETKKKCDLLEQKYNKISVIHQENAGVSSARNTGIKAAKGNWIVFLDADDRMAPESIENALKLAEEKNSDTICWNCYSDCGEKIDKYPAIHPDGVIYQEPQTCSVLIEALYNTRVKEFYPGQMFRAVWGKLLSADIIKKNMITFPIGLPLGEDAAFLANYFCCCNKVLFVNRYWNYYKILSDSVVGKYKSNLKELQMLELETIMNRVQSEKVDMNTILLNQYLQFDYQCINNLYKKENNILAVYKGILQYIKDRHFEFKRFTDYDKRKIHKQSLPVAWVMVNNMDHLEAFLCVIRELKHRHGR